MLMCQHHLAVHNDAQAFTFVYGELSVPCYLLLGTNMIVETMILQNLLWSIPADRGAFNNMQQSIQQSQGAKGK